MIEGGVKFGARRRRKEIYERKLCATRSGGADDPWPVVRRYFLPVAPRANRDAELPDVGGHCFGIVAPNGEDFLEVIGHGAAQYAMYRQGQYPMYRYRMY